MKRQMTLAEKAIDAMEGDNGCCFERSPEQMTELDAAFARMQRAGAVVDDAAIELIAAGEQTEAEAAFARCDGYVDVNRILGAIFNGEEQ